MPASGRHHIHTLADYFSTERSSPQKHEFADGQIFVMAGGTPRHNYLAARMQTALGRRIEGGPCFVLTSDQRIGTADGLHTYSDGAVFCGAVEVGPEQTATNPTVLIEVLSDSTRSYDRGEKLERYKSIPSLRHVILLEPDAVDVEIWSRGAAGWAREVRVDRDGTIRIEALDIELPVAEIYAGFERVPG